MMNRVTRSALPALVILVAGCATTTRVDRTSEEQRIRELSQQAMRAVQAKDAATFASFYADDAVSMGANQKSIRGREAIRSMVAEMFSMPNLAFSFAPTTIEVAGSGDIAQEIGTYRFAADMPGGRLDDEGKYITLWKKIAGEWKITSDITNSDKPLEKLVTAMMPRMQEAAGAIATPEPVAGVGAHFHARELVWRDAPSALPPGAKVAVLEGDPAQPGPFTLRVKVPAGYRFPPHIHPVMEHVTVLSGALSMGKGERWDDGKLIRLDAGDYMSTPAGTPHFAMATGETTFQVHSIGPFAITYVNPQDDPSKK